MFHEQSLIDALNLLIEKIESMDDCDKKILGYCEEIYNKNKISKLRYISERVSVRDNYINHDFSHKYSHS